MSGFADLAGLLTVRPLTEVLPGPTFTGSTTSPFSASWSSTVGLFAREVAHLDASRVILEAGFTETQLRQDGLPRADARPRTSGVILTLVGTPHGDLRYPSSTYWDWQSNVRALALTFEMLRAVDRYGVTKRGQQYAGWKALPAGDAIDVGRSHADVVGHGRDLILRAGSPRRALALHHPDHGGAHEDFVAVQAAIDEDPR